MFVFGWGRLKPHKSELAQNWDPCSTWKLPPPILSRPVPSPPKLLVLNNISIEYGMRQYQPYTHISLLWDLT